MASKQNNIYKSIVVIEESDIVKCGLRSLLRDHNLGINIFMFDSLASCSPSAYKLESPELILINPGLINESIDKLKQKLEMKDRPLIVGIVYAFFEKCIMDFFDETICIDDSEESIVSKLKILRSEFPLKHSYFSNNKLSDRELEVLKLLIKGLSNKEVANLLSISTHTVISHRRNIVGKTGIKSLAGLAVYAILNNIVEFNDISK